MAINEVTSIDVKTLPPFKRLIMTLGELPTSYLESMTYAELLMWFCNFLQEKVLPAINNNADALQDVITYLENLDLQDEVNNKLDEMAESGQLQEIIADYLNSKAIFGFDTVADMKSATNLIDGSYAKTLGYHTKNDGGMATYKIRQITNDDIVDEMLIIALNDDSLIAELILSDTIIPEQLGAYGDNIHDDKTVLQFALYYSKIKHVSLSRAYKISSGLDVADGKVVDGGGSIYSDGSCFEIDGHEHLIIKDLRLFPTTNAIHIYSDTSYSNYNLFENLHCEGKNTTDSKGLFIEPTNRYINEILYNNCVFWNFNYGIYAVNNTDKEMSAHKFTECSTETSTVLGQYIKNGSDFVFNNCRHVEAISNKWTTEGTCNNLIINGVAWFVGSSNMPNFSSDTNGQILNGLRTNGSPVNRPIRNGVIKNGYVIPCKETLSPLSRNANSDTTIVYGDELPYSFKFGSVNNVTLTLPDTLYGVGGKIDEIYLKVSYTGGTSTIVIGSTTIATLPAYNGNRYYKAICITEASNEKWIVEQLTTI